MTAEFLEFSKAAGNDLSTPRPEFGFAGLKPGDRWCVCAGRWMDAFEAGVAPPVVMQSTHENALEDVPFAALKKTRPRPFLSSFWRTLARPHIPAHDLENQNQLGCGVKWQDQKIFPSSI